MRELTIDAEMSASVIAEWRRLVRAGDWRGESPLVELGEELVLGVGDGLGVESGDLGGGFCLADSGFGLRGKKGAVALGVGVALGDGGGDAGGTGVCRCGVAHRRDGCRPGVLGAAGAMGGETLRHLFFQCKGRSGFRFGRGFVQW